MEKFFRKLLFAIMFLAGTFTFIACNDDDDNNDGGKNGDKPGSSTKITSLFKYEDGVNVFTMTEADIKNMILSKGFEFMEEETEDDIITYIYKYEDANGNIHILDYSKEDGTINEFSYGILTDGADAVVNCYTDLVNQGNKYMKEHDNVVFGIPMDFIGSIQKSGGREELYYEFDTFMSILSGISLSNLVNAFADFYPLQETYSTSENLNAFGSEIIIFNGNLDKDLDEVSKMFKKTYGIILSNEVWASEDYDQGEDWTKKKVKRMLTLAK